MNFELYKPYKARGGWKAVVVDILGFGTDRFLKVYHEKGGYVYDHNMSGVDMRDAQCDLLEPWAEPIKRTFWVNVYDGHFAVYETEKVAKVNSVKFPMSGQFPFLDTIRIDYVQGATHYVAKGE